jgi:hypothetical protein
MTAVNPTVVETSAAVDAGNPPREQRSDMPPAGNVATPGFMGMMAIRWTA